MPETNQKRAMVSVEARGLSAAADAWAEQAARSERLALGAIGDMMGEQGLVGLLAVLAGACAVAGIVPSFSTILGTPMLFLSLWMAAGGHQVAFPDWMSKRHVEGEKAASVFRKAAALLRRIERLAAHPRQEWVFVIFGRRAIGLFCVVMSVIVLLPIPFMNFAPSVAIIWILVAWLERDGFMALGGILAGGAAIGIIPSLAVFFLVG